MFKYQLLLIGYGYDEQLKQKWINLYLQNQLYQLNNSKLIITCRITPLPSEYKPYFLPYHPGSNNNPYDGYQELFIQPFQQNEIEKYIDLFIESEQQSLNKLIEKGIIDSKWKGKKIYFETIKNTNGLIELMKTPLMSRLVLEALPYLSISSNNSRKSKKIVRGEIYEGFLIKWMKQQEQKQKEKFEYSLIWKHGQEIVSKMYSENPRKVEINLGQKIFQFDFSKGKFIEKENEWNHLISNNPKTKFLPLQHCGQNKFKFLHLSIQ